MSEQHTLNRKYGIRTLGDAYPDVAKLISNTTADGDSRPTKHETIWKQGLKVEEKGQRNRDKSGYKKAGRRPKNTTNALINMQNSPEPNPQSYHSHSDISTAHILRNLVIHTKLSLALLSITSPDTWITESNYNSHIPDSYFAKVYLPNATLSGYKNGVLKTAKGQAFACIHFNPNDHRIFEITGLNTPDSESHVPNHNNVEVPTCPSTASSIPSSTTNHYVTRPPTPDPQQVITRPICGVGSPTLATSGYTPTAPSVSHSLELLDPPAVMYPGQTTYEDLFTFGSHPAGEHAVSDDKNDDKYTHVEWLFLTQVLDYC